MTPTADQLLAHAATFIGVHETPPGSNRGPQIDKWERRAQKISGEPWCACFAWCMLDDLGLMLPIPYPAAVGSWVEWCRGQGLLRKRPYRGMPVSFSWAGATPTPSDHVGFVEKVLALPRNRPKTPQLSGKYWLLTLEGNAGDAVRHQLRWVDPAAVAFMDVLRGG